MRAMGERTPDRPWSVPVTLHEIPETGRRFDLNADEATRAVIAKAVGLRALPRLEASFDVVRHGTKGLHVVGRVSATVGQFCVVTLDPIESEVEELVDIIFVAGAAPAGEHAPGKGRQVEIATTETSRNIHLPRWRSSRLGRAAMPSELRPAPVVSLAGTLRSSMVIAPARPRLRELPHFRLLAHVPAKWIPVRRQEHAPPKEARACPDSKGIGHALGPLHVA